MCPDGHDLEHLCVVCASCASLTWVRPRPGTLVVPSCVVPPSSSRGCPGLPRVAVSFLRGSRHEHSGRLSQAACLPLPLSALCLSTLGVFRFGLLFCHLQSEAPGFLLAGFLAQGLAQGRRLRNHGWMSDSPVCAWGRGGGQGSARRPIAGDSLAVLVPGSEVWVSPSCPSGFSTPGSQV